MPDEGPKGAQKAAILLLAMGEEAAVNVLGQLKEVEVSKIGLAASSLGDLPPDTAESVLDEFSEMQQYIDTAVGAYELEGGIRAL